MYHLSQHYTFHFGISALRCACLLPQLVLRPGFTVQGSVQHCFVVSSTQPHIPLGELQWGFRNVRETVLREKKTTPDPL